MILGIAHNAMIVSDMKKSLEFYVGLLELKKAFDINDDDDNPWIIYLKIANNAFIELFYGGVKSENKLYDETMIGYRYIGINVININYLEKKLYENNVIDSISGKDEFMVFDPDGNAIKFIEHGKNESLKNFSYHSIANIALTTGNMEEALDYYMNKLNFKLIDSYNEKDVKVNILELKNGSKITLYSGGKISRKIHDTTSGFLHFCLECEDVYKTYEELKDRKTPLRGLPTQGKDFNYQAWTGDPDGVAIELMTIDKKSPQANS